MAECQNHYTISVGKIAYPFEAPVKDITGVEVFEAVSDIR